MIEEEESIRTNLGFKKITDGQLQKMRGAIMGQALLRSKANKRLEAKGIVEIPCYDLLFNPEYQDSFMFVPLVDRIEGQDYSASSAVPKYLYKNFHTGEESKKDLEKGNLSKKN